ncbi:MAG: hypothetical protein NVSMB1_12200 [Polyangiales bacterium]
MRAFRPFLVLSFLCPVAVLSAPESARADDPQSAEISAARDLGSEGIKLANAGRCADAVEKLSRAAKLYPAPTIVERLGECEIELGKIVEGSEVLQRVLRDPLPLNPPNAFLVARARAQEVLNKAKPRICRLRVVVKGPSPADVVVRVDGEPMSSALLGADRPTDPGPHTVEISAPSYRTNTTKLTLAEGASQSLAITLEEDPAARVAAPPLASTKPDSSPSQVNTVGSPATSAPNDLPTTSGEKSSRAPALVALTIGIAGIATGVTFGIIAINKRNELDGTCTNHSCPPSDRDGINSLKTMSTVSTIAFIAGGVGLAVGIPLFVWSGSSSEAHEKTAVSLKVKLGSDGASLLGSF